MSIDDLNRIDLIGADPERPDIELIITDHRDWDDVEAHLKLLNAKIGGYVAFIASDQLRNLPNIVIPENAQLSIVVVTLCQPPDAAKDFLKSIESALGKRGIRFEVRRGPTLTASERLH